MNNDVHKQIVCTTESKQTKNRIEIELWNKEFESDKENPLVIIIAERGMLHLSIQDIPGLIIALISLLVKRRFKRIK